VPGHDVPVELEAVDGDFVVTPAMARLLVKLARARLEAEASGPDRSRTEEDADSGT
jgi:hypothetical protein